MNDRQLMHFLLALAISAACVSCKKSSPVEATAAGQANADEHGGGAHAGEGREEGAEAKEPSDLDRPIEELVALTCEHKKRTLACDECRYEVGFV